ncbi:MAG: hypothetical protein BMS9Abin33_0304 [Gammaproteobacteria bacterium]|nr:MAG: hypothetical protein BMS9Abin33_0304 [Gammaproteobacteria bacterium]
MPLSLAGAYYPYISSYSYISSIVELFRFSGFGPARKLLSSTDAIRSSVTGTIFVTNPITETNPTPWLGIYVAGKKSIGYRIVIADTPFFAPN